MRILLFTALVFLNLGCNGETLPFGSVSKPDFNLQTNNDISFQLPAPTNFIGRNCADLEDGRTICWGPNKAREGQINRSSRCAIEGNTIECDQGTRLYNADFNPKYYKVNGRAVCAYGDEVSEIQCWKRNGELIDSGLYRFPGAKIKDLFLVTHDMIDFRNDDGPGACAVYEYSDHSEVRCWNSSASKLWYGTKPGEAKISSIGHTSPRYVCALQSSALKCVSHDNGSLVEQVSLDVKKIFPCDGIAEIENAWDSGVVLCALTNQNTLWEFINGGDGIYWEQIATPWSFQGYRSMATNVHAIVLADTAFMVPMSYGSYWTSPSKVDMPASQAKSINAAYGLTCLSDLKDKACTFVFPDSGLTKKIRVPVNEKVVGGYKSFCRLVNGEVFCTDTKLENVKIDFSGGLVSDIAMSNNFLCGRIESGWSCKFFEDLKNSTLAPALRLPTESAKADQAGVGDGYFCGLVDSAPRCWDERGAKSVPDLKNVERLSVGGALACALTGGKATCWWLGSGALLELPKLWKEPILEISAAANAGSNPYYFRSPFVCAVTKEGFGCKEATFDTWFPFK